MMRELGWITKPIFWLLLSLALLWLAIFQLPDGRLHVVFCDVGQGDATLITYRSTQVLIDGGPNKRVLQCLADNLPFWDRTIEMIFLTHPEADHFTGLIDVMERYIVKYFIVNSIIPDSVSTPKYSEGIFGGQGFWEFHRAAISEGVEVYSPQSGDKIRLGPMSFLVLWPQEKLGDSRIWQREAFRDAWPVSGQHLGRWRSNDFDSSEVDTHLRGVHPATSEVLGAATYDGNLNETSIVLKLSFGNFDALFTGDIGFDIEEQINWLAEVEVLKVAHHGSKYSTGEDFLRKVQPFLAVISVGKNSFGHPTQEVIDRLNSQAIKFLRTDQEGEIEIIADGQKWGIKK